MCDHGRWGKRRMAWPEAREIEAIVVEVEAAGDHLGARLLFPNPGEGGVGPKGEAKGSPTTVGGTPPPPPQGSGEG